MIPDDVSKQLGSEKSEILKTFPGNLAYNPLLNAINVLKYNQKENILRRLRDNGDGVQAKNEDMILQGIEQVERFLLLLDDTKNKKDTTQMTIE